MKATAVPMMFKRFPAIPMFLRAAGTMAAFFPILFSIALVGCSGKAENTPDTPKGIKKVLERGPMTLTLRTSAESMSTAETLSLTLSATLEDGYSVEFPDYPEPAEPETPTPETPAPVVPPEFTSAGYDDAAPVLSEDGKVTRSRTYRLDPFLEGAYTIPPLSVSFWKEVEGDDEKATAETEPVTVTVASVLAPNAQPGVMDIAGPVAVQNPTPWLLYFVLLVLLVAILCALYWYKFIRVVPGPPPPPPVPPHVRALEALQAIEREKLVEKGLYKEYYIRVSDVLRHYMEDEFHLRAPERTTEEFLAEIQHNAVLGLQEQLLLRAFLRHCDLVKFAKAEPSSEEIRETFQTCEKFIIDSEAAHRAAKKAAAQAAATAGV
jgi:hypothetical protein